MYSLKKITALFFLLLSSIGILAQTELSTSLSVGYVVNYPLPLSISQHGYPDIKQLGRFHSEPFNFPLYWDFKITRIKNKNLCEFEFIHHKLYLNNLSDEIQRFSISHGFNLLLINSGYAFGKFFIKPGMGIVLGHPENTIRNLPLNEKVGLFNDGYYISGSAVNLAINSRIKLTGLIFLETEAKITYGYAYVPVANGKAKVHNLAFHLTLGLGFRQNFRNKAKEESLQKK